MKPTFVLFLLTVFTGSFFFFSCNPEGHRPTPTNYIINGPQDVDPAWSPDGNSIAYAHLYDTTKAYPQGLYLIDWNGNNRKLVLAGYHFSPAWSPDGQWLVFTSGGKIQKCKLDGSSLTTFTGLDNLQYPEFYHPKWSPNGKFIMFEKPLGASNTSLYSTTSDFKTFGSLFGLEIPTGNYPVQSPDQKKLLCVKGDQFFVGGTEIFVIDTLGLIDVRLTNNKREDRAPFWSPDGKMIVWSNDLRISIMNSDGSSQRDINFGNDPNWSVNNEIVFSHANGNYTKEVLYVVLPDGKNRKQITF